LDAEDAKKEAQCIWNHLLTTVIPNHLQELDLDTLQQPVSDSQSMFAVLADNLLTKTQFLTAKQVRLCVM